MSSKPSTNMSYLESLPVELILESFSKMNLDELKQVCIASKKLKSICDTHQSAIYKMLLKRDFVLDNQVLYTFLVGMDKRFKTHELVDSRNPMMAVVFSKQKGFDLLSQAINAGNREVIKALLDKSKHLLESSNSLGETALMLAIKTGEEDIVKYVLSNTPDRAIGVLDRYQNSALSLALDKGMSLEIVRRIFKKTPMNLLQLKNEGGRTIMMLYLLNFTDFYMYKTLIQHGVSILATSPDGYTCFHFALVGGNYQIIRDMFDKHYKNNLMFQTSDGFSYLHVAVETGKQEIIELLLSGEIRLVNMVDNDGNNALFALYKSLDHLIESDVVNCSESLILNGTNVNHQNASKETSMMLFLRESVGSGFSVETVEEIIDLFVEQQYDWSLSTQDGKNALFYLMTALRVFDTLENYTEHNVFEIARFVLQAGASSYINSQDFDGNTALMYFYINSYSEHLRTAFNIMTDLFVEFGANISIANYRGRAISNIVEG